MGYCQRFLLILVLALYGRSCQAQALVPLSSAEQTQLVTAHNKFRGMLEGGNEQCITGYDSSLQTVAENIAKNCSVDGVRDKATNGLAFLFKLQPDDKPTMEEFVEELYVGLNDYDYAQSSCIDEIPCKSFLSFAWFENSKIGCALATCNSVAGAPTPNSQQYLGVCAYNHKADLTARPYVAPPECQFCPNSASICTNGLCCPFDLAAGACPPTAAVVGQAKPSNLSSLYRVSKTKENIVLTTNETLVQQLVKAGAISSGVVGQVTPAGNDSSCGLLKAIHHLYSPHFKSNYYIMDSHLYTVRMREGYQDKGVIGYSVQGVNTCGAEKAMYEFFRYKDGITQVPNSTEVPNYMDYKSGYIYHGISFALWG